MINGQPSGSAVSEAGLIDCLLHVGQRLLGERSFRCLR